VVVQFGWRPAYVLLRASVILGVSLPGYLIFREDPESIGLSKDGVREGLTPPPALALTDDRD
jgi:hypothetical protein